MFLFVCLAFSFIHINWHISQIAFKTCSQCKVVTLNDIFVLTRISRCRIEYSPLRWLSSTHTPAVYSNAHCDEDEAANDTSNYGTNDIFWRTGFLGCVQKKPLSLNVLIKTTQNEVFKHGINALCKSVREFIIIALTIICVFITCNHCEIIRWNDIKD